MAIPERIPVTYFEDYYTSHIGFYNNGKQFWAQIVASIDPNIHNEPRHGDEWHKYKRWYAILHKFDEHGKHLETEHWFAGTTADGEQEVIERARQRRDDMITKLGHVEFRDIAIRLFQVEIDKDLFGLIDTSSTEFGETVTMEPADFVFYPPWTGEYDT